MVITAGFVKINILFIKIGIKYEVTYNDGGLKFYIQNHKILTLSSDDLKKFAG